MSVATVVQSGTGASQLVPLDTYQHPFQVSLSVVVAGAATYSVEYTYDNVLAVGYTPLQGTWFTAPEPSGTTSGDGMLGMPVRAVRLVVTAGVGSAALTVIQAGP